MSKLPHPTLQREMKKHHLFLYELYMGNSKKNRNLLYKASKQEVYVVLRILYCISAGHIPISKKNFQEITRRKKRIMLARLKSRSIYLRKKETLFNRKKYVLQYCSVYPYLFQSPFIEI